MNSKFWLLLPLICGCNSWEATPAETAGNVSHSSKYHAPATSNSESTRAAIIAWNLALEPAPLRSIEMFPVPDSPNLCLAICDYEARWWGFFGLYELHDGHVTWQAECPQQPTEQSVRWLRGLRLSGFSNPIIEVFGQTHMGNGSLYLYEIREQSLKLLLSTRAVDDHIGGDGEVFQNGHLLTDYTDLNRDGIADVRLYGDIERLSADGTFQLSKRPCEKAFLWITKSGKFEEERSRRIGVSDDHD